MNPKPAPNHQEYLTTLAHMSPPERLRCALELSDFTRRLFKLGLRQRFPDLSTEEFHELYLQRLALCHNRNY